MHGRTKPTCSSASWVNLSTSPQSRLSWRVQMPRLSSPAKKSLQQDRNYFSKNWPLSKIRCSNSNSNYYKPRWHRSQCCGQKCTRVRCARVKTRRELRCGWVRNAPYGWAGRRRVREWKALVWGGLPHEFIWASVILAPLCKYS
jgi:hypothetical protein